MTGDLKVDLGQVTRFTLLSLNLTVNLTELTDEHRRWLEALIHTTSKVYAETAYKVNLEYNLNPAKT